MSVYVVRKGDNLFRIATNHGTTLAKVAELNPHIENLDLIFPGMAVNLPGSAVVRLEEPVNGSVPWYRIAEREFADGVTEIRGRRDNPRIIEYHASTSLKASNDETAWCSSFVNWCVSQAGLTGTNSAAARSWLDWSGGKVINTPVEGCIAVLRRVTKPWQGHVGFFVKQSATRVTLLGGNQGDAVTRRSYARDRVISYIMPR